MKIQQYERVRYTNNPLAEVVCQARFPFVQDFVDSIPDRLRAKFEELGYVQASDEQSFNISIAIGGKTGESIGTMQNGPTPVSRIFHFASLTEPFKVSICSEFVALTCGKYLSWDDFCPRFMTAYGALREFFDEIFPIRVGLRYKDVIERESLGLQGVPWNLLISPFLLGPLLACAFSDDVVDAEESISTFISQSTIQLEDCSLLLQSALLQSMDGDRKAFLIDSDFFIDNSDPEALTENGQLVELLTRLHTNAGSLFRRGITKELHDALGPNPV